MLSTVAVTMIVLATLLGGYIITSYFFLKYPKLLHKRKKLKFKAVHISHRGGAGENLENTIAAFKHASDQGTDMFEIDLHLTKDGQVVITHDNDVERATGCDVLISDTNYADIPPLKESLRLDFMWVHTTQNHGGDRKIPLLRDVFEKFPTIPVNIDIKIDKDELIRQVSDLAKEYNREHLVVWGSRHDSVTRKCYAENPNIPVLFSLRRALLLVVMYYTGILPFVPLKESAYEILMPSTILAEGRFRRPIGWKVRCLLRFADSVFMSRSLFKHLQKRGIHTYLWVLNDEQEFDRAFRYGATGVMTDFPTKLRKYLDEHPQYELK